MKIKTFVLNKNNKIELTEKQLKDLLDEVYWDGYRDGSKTTYTYTTPSWQYISPTIAEPNYKPIITCTTSTTKEIRGNSNEI